MKIILWTLSKIYGFLATSRRFFYENGLIPQKKLPIPVISIGNLSVGGTGKTPITIFTAKALQKKGFKVCVLSRGYKRKSQELIIAQDTNNISYEDVGDEPYIMLKQNIPIAVHKDRYKAGVEALKKIKPDIFILDDGFQHYQLYKDIDNLVTDATKPFWEDQLLPLGRLREPPSFSMYADSIIITRLHLLKEQRQKEILEQAKKFNKPVFIAREKIEKILDPFSNTYPLEILKGKKVTVFAGLGNNTQFFETVKKLSQKYDFSIEEFISFPDHYDYKNFKPKKERIYLTTEKDIIKIKEKNVFALNYEIDIDKDYEELILNKIKKREQNARKTPV
ncbi:MAG: tetraacyldisaccharide 4'-kinase [Aquificae bacterium]|nr:tetraacyldisaccharide 4'-kinase [Aquificota bacterium]